MAISTTTDPDLLAAAIAIYGNRQDQKFGGNRRWRALKEQHPELAEAVRPVVPVNLAECARDVWGDYRDEAERDHRHMESWARSQTASSTNYFYRGARHSVLHDAKGSTPKWMRPYKCWEHTDRGRWVRGSGADADVLTTHDEHVTHRVRGRDLRTLHVETDGNYSIEGDGIRDNILEVCRLCGTALEMLTRDENGNVTRSRGGQPEYCSDRCKLDVFNARRRAARRRKPKSVTAPPTLTPGWDRVTSRWRYPANRCVVETASLKQASEYVWRIAQ